MFGRTPELVRRWVRGRRRLREVRALFFVAIALALPAGTARADLRIAFDNDIFAHLQAKDDDGFTNDLDVRFWRPYREYLIGGRLFDRWVTEEPRVAGGRR